MKKWIWPALAVGILGSALLVSINRHPARARPSGDAMRSEREGVMPVQASHADPAQTNVPAAQAGMATNLSPRAADPSRTVMRRMPGETTNAPIKISAHFPKTPWTPQINRMQAALDDGDSDAALTAARELINAPNVDARRAAVDLFRWIGPKALPELTRMLADPEEDLAELALEGWQMALGEITDHSATMQQAANAVVELQDEYARHEFMMEISLLPDEIAAGYYTCMLDVQDRRVVELALEYMTFMAQEPIENKDDAARWMARLKAEAAADAAREKAIEEQFRP
jgi:hypothetical protein